LPRRFFRTKCEYTASLRQKSHHFPRRRRTEFLKSISSPVNAFRQREPVPQKTNEGGSGVKPLATENGTPRNVNGLVINLTSPTPSGTLLQDASGPFQRRPPPSAIPEAHEEEEHPQVLVSSPVGDDTSLNFVSHSPTHDPDLDPSAELPQASVQDFGLTSPESKYGKSTGVDIAAVTSMTSPRSVHYNAMMDFKGVFSPGAVALKSKISSDGRPTPKRGATMLTNRHRDPLAPESTRHQGLGGYPGPLDLINRFAKRAAPRTYNRLERKLTITSALEIDNTTTPWLNFSGLITGRNSDFRIETLSDDQVEELGGTEYRALRLLSYLIPAVSSSNLQRLDDTKLRLVLHLDASNGFHPLRTVAIEHLTVRHFVRGST
jgi:hypothetical protein